MRKVVLLMIIPALLLSGCLGVVTEVRSEPVMGGPADQAGPGMAEPQEKVVTMVAYTPTPMGLSPTPTPYVAMPGATPTQILDFMETTPSGTLADLGIEAATYQDEHAGFALEYPADWEIIVPSDEIIEQSRIYSVSLGSSFDQQGPKQQEGLAPGQAKMDVTVIRDGPTSLAEAANQRRAQWMEPGSQAKLLSEEVWNLNDGLQAHHFRVVGNVGPMAEVVLVIDGQMLLIVAYGELSLFNPIVGSLRLLS